jgi:SAM-dependent methyltransferase
VDFTDFDIRRYKTLPVQQGYAEWVDTYEDTVQDEMDVRLLERVTSVSWSELDSAIDLACGTGRTGAWLKGKGVSAIDGIDITPAMLSAAHRKDIYRKLVLGNITDTELTAEQYDLSIEVLADEHLPDLYPLYREAARITKPEGYFVVVGYHPHFLMKGLITHFHRANGEPVAIESYVHLLSDHAKAAHAAQWSLLEMDEGVVDESWLRKKPKWQKYRNRPVSFAMVWQRRH